MITIRIFGSLLVNFQDFIHEIFAFLTSSKEKIQKSYTQKTLFRNSSAADEIHLRKMI
jgi:hypothetical protein